MSINPFTDYPLSWRPDKKKLRRPLAANLVDQMRADIAAGRLQPGTQLPPQRELADYLDIGFSTVTRAYKLSQEEGLTFGRVGQGTFISGHAHTPLAITRNRAENVEELGFVASFESANRLAKKTIQAVAQETRLLSLLNYDSPSGLDRHKIIATRYLNQVGMTANVSNTVIASGGENALSIALASLFNAGDRLAVDRFTYANLIDMARLYGVKLVPITGDEEGMLPDELDLACQQQNLSGIYLMPDCGNPTLMTISEGRRRELARVIQKYKLILIEDDYLSFLNLYRDQPLIKMSVLVPDHSVYIASMSKPLISGLRVAFVRPADQFKAQYERALFTLNVKTSSLDAEIIARLLENGQAGKIIQEKMKLMRQNNAIYDRVFKTRQEKEKPAFFRLLPLRAKTDGKQVEEELLDNKIRVFHSDRFLAGHKKDDDFLRVSLAAIDDPAQLEAALRKLKKILEEKQYI